MGGPMTDGSKKSPCQIGLRRILIDVQAIIGKVTLVL